MKILSEPKNIYKLYYRCIYLSKTCFGLFFLLPVKWNGAQEFEVLSINRAKIKKCTVPFFLSNHFFLSFPIIWFEREGRVNRGKDTHIILTLFIDNIMCGWRDLVMVPMCLSIHASVAHELFTQKSYKDFV